MLTHVTLAPTGDFPLLAREIEGRRVIYLDSAATTLKPRAVIDAVVRFYEHSTANIHRGDHTLSQEASEAFESTRSTVARFLNANAREILFTANTTEGLNLVARGLGLKPGDNVVGCVQDHHSNLLPWMGNCELRLVGGSSDGRIDLSQLDSLIDDRTRLVALTHASNVTGVIHPVREAIAIARRRNVPTCVDAAQSVPHLPVDVGELGCDFLAFSGHKMLAPSGVGVLYVAEAQLERLAPLKLGGGVVDHVREDGFSLKRVPHRFEAGTPNIEGVLGLGAAVRYLDRLGMEAVRDEGTAQSRRLREKVAEIPGLELVGPVDARDTLPIVTVAPVRATVDAARLGMMLSDSYKIMARSGTHCAHPFYARAKVRGALRLSAFVYNSDEDLDLAASALREIMARIG
jgi:cysteine desulfurase/selenocysteine lyase